VRAMCGEMTQPAKCETNPMVVWARFADNVSEVAAASKNAKRTQW
jgi:hypothetical protein